MDFLTWAILGLVAGILAKWLMPGPDSGGLIMTILLGVVGALVGGRIAGFMGWGGVNGLNLPSLAFAIGGSMAVLLIYRIITGKV
ncbi:MAG: GlsB/YeaQ/YmgE family stress response membrane protein [Gemmataceae bacterium]|nr:GlsB/YeaQ/YmgE family stress response membrane protein [Gemmataceae bacterium]